jgi:RNA polymerase sigma factor for flagellar operon FliA
MIRRRLGRFETIFMAPATSGATVEQRKVEERLVVDHLPLVHYAVSEMVAKVPRHVSRDDLVSAGMAGLAQAARSFDAERGIAFDRYASTRIRGALLDELRDRDWASRSVRSKARQVAAATDELTATLGRTPSKDELAGHVGLDTTSIDALSEDVHRAVVLNYDSLLAEGDAEDVMPSTHVTPDSVILDRERRAYLLDAISALSDRLRRVVIGYFFEERSMQDIAEELGVSESRISQMRAEALALLKDGMNSQLDPEALPVEAKPSPRVARRRAAYYAAIAAGSDYRSRLNAVPIVAGPARTRGVA